MVAPNREPIIPTSTPENNTPVWRRRGVVAGLTASAALLAACSPTAEGQPTSEPKETEIEQSQTETPDVEATESSPEVDPTDIPDIFPEVVMELITSDEYQNATLNDASYLDSQAWSDLKDSEVSGLDTAKGLHTGHIKYYQYVVNRDGQPELFKPNLETGETPYDQYVDYIHQEMTIPKEVVDAFQARNEEPLLDAIEEKFTTFLELANDGLELYPEDVDQPGYAFRLQNQALADAMSETGHGVTTYDEATTSFFDRLQGQLSANIMVQDQEGTDAFDRQLGIVNDYMTGEPIILIRPQLANQAANTEAIIYVDTIVEVAPVVDPPKDQEIPLMQSSVIKSPVKFEFGLEENESGDFRMSLGAVSINQPGEYDSQFTDRIELDNSTERLF